MAAISVENISDKARQVGTVFPDSVTDAGQKGYDRVVGGVQWYLEKWEDLIEEARASQQIKLAEVSLEEVFASLPEAPVASDIPGRLRVRTHLLKGQSRLAQQCTTELDGLPGISEVHVSSLTGSVLVFYDTEVYESRGELLQALSQA